jgi:hypothetical protein
MAIRPRKREVRETGPNFTEAQKRFVTWTIIVLLAVALGVVVGVWAAAIIGALLGSGPGILRQRFAAIVGLPAAGAVAFVIVMVFRQTAGPIEFEAAFIKFKGAAGPVILWALCFLAIAGAIKMLW